MVLVSGFRKGSSGQYFTLDADVSRFEERRTARNMEIDVPGRAQTHGSAVIAGLNG